MIKKRMKPIEKRLGHSEKSKMAAVKNNIMTKSQCLYGKPDSIY